MNEEDGDKQLLMARVEELERALRLIRDWVKTEKATTADEKLSTIKTICDAALD